MLFCLVGEVVVRHVGVGDRDAGVDLLVQQLVDGQRTAQVALQVVQRTPGGGQARLELLLCVRGLHLGQLAVHVGIGRGQVLLGGALLHDLFHDQLVQDVQLQRVFLVGGRGLLLRIVGQLRSVDLVHVGTQNRLPVDGSDHAVLRALAATGEEYERGHNKNGWCGANLQHAGGFFLRIRPGRKSNLSVTASLQEMGRFLAIYETRPWPSADVESASGTLRKRARNRCSGSSSV